MDLNGAKSALSAKAGRKRVSLFAIDAPQRRMTVDAAASTATVTGADVELTKAAGRVIKRALKLAAPRAARSGGCGPARSSSTPRASRCPARARAVDRRRLRRRQHRGRQHGWWRDPARRHAWRAGAEADHQRAAGPPPPGRRP